jgi:hypothetical protein
MSKRWLLRPDVVELFHVQQQQRLWQLLSIAQPQWLHAQSSRRLQMQQRYLAVR